MACLGTDTLLAIAHDRSPDRLQRFDRHFDSCNECRELVADLVKLSWMRGARTHGPESTQTAAIPVWLPAGQLIDRYIIIELVGVGGMGAVYAAYDPRLDRKVALKVLRPTDHADELGARLLSEAKMLARLGDPHVVAVYDAGVVHGNVFVAMELVNGSTLRQWLQERPRTWRETVAVFLQAAAGLAAAHAAGVIHRDFKPDNVLMGGDGRARVADFGLARASETPPSSELDAGSSSARGTAIAGTPAYMAPEQRRGAASALADQYSFCVALREGLRSAGDDAPGRIVAAVERGLSIDPEQRHPSIQALADALRPRARKRFVAVGATVAAACISIATFAAIRSPSAAGPTCGNAATELAGIWNPRTREALRMKLLVTGRPDAFTTFEAVASRLGGYAETWITERNDSCEATHVRGEQSQALLDQRMACLDVRRSEFAARVTAVRSVLSNEFLDADHVLAGLVDPRLCTSRAALAHESTPVHSGEISEFDDGTMSSRFGTGWSVSTDSVMGGRSIAHLAITDGGFGGSGKALAITGNVDAGDSPIRWAGAMFYPGRAAMAPADLSAHRAIVFAARGDRAAFAVLMFSASKGFLPAARIFDVGDEWKEYRFALSEFDGVNSADITGVLFASTRTGGFALQIDHVRFE